MGTSCPAITTMRFYILVIIGLLLSSQSFAQSSEDSTEFSITTISRSIQSKMTNTTWNKSCPVSLSELRIVNIKHWNFKSETQTGQLIVHKSISIEIQTIFKKLFQQKALIHSVIPMYKFGGNDEKSMLANNTSVFNCRRNTMNPSKFSIHSYGKAIDINPLQNPLVYKRNNKTKVIPQEATPNSDRSLATTGMIHKGDTVWQTFVNYNWQWGGTWRRVKDLSLIHI